jgi:hypothetical protein
VLTVAVPPRQASAIQAAAAASRAMPLGPAGDFNGAPAPRAQPGQAVVRAGGVRPAVIPPPEQGGAAGHHPVGRSAAGDPPPGGPTRATSTSVAPTQPQPARGNPVRSAR